MKYREAGVDIDRAEKFVKSFYSSRAETESKFPLINKFGQFSAGIDISRYKEPVLFTTCDGIGSKLKLLEEYNLLETAGQDLVAMNVNDILTSGAEPVSFLDYIGAPKIEDSYSKIVEGIIDYLKLCNCTLAGGETAEMPHISNLELSGFCAGIAEKKDVIDIYRIEEGDIIVGFPSNGFHANGFSLIRKIIDFNEPSFQSAIFSPTKLYYDECKFLSQFDVVGLAHITGGGLPGNISRLLNSGLSFSIKIKTWDNSAIKKINEHVSIEECFKTFNMGIGFVAIIKLDSLSEKMFDNRFGTCILGTVGGYKNSYIKYIDHNDINHTLVF